MIQSFYQKGKFYTLPIVSVRDEGSNSFFIVSANGREYAIRMFDFQRRSPEVRSMEELPCMVKDVHGESVVFVQNFARMFSDRYVAGKSYQFVVSKEVYNPESECRYYDIRDSYGVPFRLKCSADTYLMPSQKVRCTVSRPNANQMILSLEAERSAAPSQCAGAEELLVSVGVDAPLCRFILGSFRSNPGFAEAREYQRHGNAVWVVKAVMAVGGVETWPHLNNGSCMKLLEVYRRVCMYLLEDTDYLLQFGEAEREDYQEWIAGRVDMADVYMRCLSLSASGRVGEEIDSILGKIRHSGYIYRPHSRMRQLIALFSMQPQLLEEKIDSILDLVAERAKDWKQPSFTDAFSSFFRFYIAANRDRANRVAVIDEDESRVLLNRMVRSLCFLLLMTGGGGSDGQFYKSLLLHYLSFVRMKSVLNAADIKKGLADTLAERAFTTLLLSADNSLNIAWGQDFSNAELFAYRMANMKTDAATFLTRSFESDGVRFTVSTDGITLSRSYAAKKERNVLPKGVADWHNLQIFLDSPSKYNISPQTKNIHKWKTYWNDVELGLFEQRRVAKKPVKLAPEVGTVTYVRVLWQDASNPCRFYCKIEDTAYEGEGWLDTYQKGGAMGMFHYDPKFTMDAFVQDGSPIIIKVRVNSVGSPKDERPLCVFDCMAFIDDIIRSQVEYDEESDCNIVFRDDRTNVLLGITGLGYGIFIPCNEDNEQYVVGDCVRVRVTDATRPNAIQGEIVGMADYLVDVTAAATEVLLDYWDSTGSLVYEATDEELEEEAMGVSEDLFDTSYMTEIVNILDHKAVLAADNITAYAFLSLGHILARLTADRQMMDYLEQRQHFLCILEDYATNGKVNDRELETLGSNDDMVEQFPLLKQRLTEMRIINSLGRPEKNAFLWDITSAYTHDHILSRLARLMLSYNMAEGFALHDFQQAIVAKIKSLLNVNVELPKIYSFGEEDQLTEFKSSVVFPPNNGMRPDMKQQTFNIMKVICGMVNSYGGTVYLGVFDTGTAKGLDEDLPFFNGSTDKFDLYVRNSIRTALGDKVNAAIVVEHPDAGKHYVYAIHVKPSRQPVALALDGCYYLRQGTSTYPIELQELQEIMDERDFATYNAVAVDTDSSGDVTPPEASPSATAASPSATSASLHAPSRYADGDSIATSRQRINVVNNWEEGYLVDTCCFVRILGVGEWCVLDSVDWEDGLLTMAVHDDEADGYLVVAYSDGRVNRVPMAQVTEKKRGSANKMYADSKPLFVSPARKDDVLLTAYEDDKGRRFFRLDDLSRLDDGKMQAAGQTLTDVEFSRMFFCEIVDKGVAAGLKRMYNMKRCYLGVQITSGYSDPETALLKRVGFVG